MTKQRDWNSIINRLTGWLVGLLAVIAFVISYNALRHVALDYGIPEQLSYVWPLLVDFALIVFSLAVLRASLFNERTVWPWTLIILSTVTTVAFNLIHAPLNRTAQVVAAVAPIILFLSFETLMAMVKNSVVRSGLIASIEQLKETFKNLEQQLLDRRTEADNLLNNLNEQLAQRQAEIDTIVAKHREEAEAAIAKLNASKQNAQKRLDTILADIEQRQQELAQLEQLQAERVQVDDGIAERRQRLLGILSEEGDIGATAFARRLGTARNTVYNDFAALEQTGVIHKNGNGWKVTN